MYRIRCMRGRGWMSSGFECVRKCNGFIVVEDEDLKCDVRMTFQYGIQSGLVSAMCPGGGTSAPGFRGWDA
jgi:hypothetical protein